MTAADPYHRADGQRDWALDNNPQLAEFVSTFVAPPDPNEADRLRSQAADDYNTAALTARWTPVVNDEIGGWAVTTNDLGPCDEGRMAADLVMTREIAEHIADVHNHWLARQNMGVPVASGFITTVDVSTPPMWRTLWRTLRRRRPSGVGG